MRRVPVRMIRAADPRVEAATIAAELGADVVGDLRSAEQAVRTRVEAGRRALGDPDADAAVIERAEAVRAAAAEPAPISEPEVADLERVALELGRAGRIRRRTQSRVTQALSDRLATTAGVALHPGALRSAADAVREAHQAVAVAEQALVDLDAELRAGDRHDRHDPDRLHDDGEAEAPTGPDTAELETQAPDPTVWTFRSEQDEHGVDPILHSPHDVFDEAALDRRRAVARAALAVVAFAALGLAAIALGQPALGTGAILAGVVAGTAIVVTRRNAHARAAASRVAYAARAPHAAPAARAPHASTAAPDTAQAADEEAPAAHDTEPAASKASAEAGDPVDEAASLRHQQRLVLLAARAEAVERLRVVEARWRRLAGGDADPLHPEAEIRAHDPQFLFDPRLAEASPTVRTVAAFHRKAEARWKVLWAALGIEDPPEPDRIDIFLEAMLGDAHRARAELRQLEAAEARVAARAALRRPLVLVEPSTWISEVRLAQLVSSIPADGQAILVERETRSETSAAGLRGP